MSFMEWALDVAAGHPDLEGAVINVDGEWLDVLLADGRTLRFRPGEMIDESAPEGKRREVLKRLITIGASMAKPAASDDQIYEDRSDSTFGPQAARGGTPSTELSRRSDDDRGQRMFGLDEPRAVDFSTDSGGPSEEAAHYRLLPIVRAADYFVTSHKHEQGDSLVYVPLTAFVGVGVAEDKPETIEPLYFSDLDERGISHDVAPLFGSAIEQLRQLNSAVGKEGLELGVTSVSGAQVFVFTAPENYQSSWFADLDMTQTVSESLIKEYGDVLPLFIPASRSSFFVALADDPHLPAMFRALRNRINDKEAIYPLPHTVASDGWQEWIPLPDHPASKILAELRVTFRAKIYRAQVAAMKTWPTPVGELKPYEVRKLRDGRFISHAQWRGSDTYGSLPDTEYVSFVREPKPLPWEDDRGDIVTLRASVARDVWSGFKAMDGVWPPRYAVSSFPTPEEMDALRQAADREL
ncbi:MAG: hypothetical protein LKJ57_00360 [Ancrocorticia sp.]|jgi:hypothetical protein|nr:hypothetical protein [Ancrocorticia sp.]MCI1895902.1 hypothetical protein [Ancrocorticia sp.]MCI1932561.1 hypothetical protein [Ancrocorticia sp.]MCI2012044.1 hypothetical protein [Ancrocorticia sp.]MCI2030189.1 hypothetical protein [Ancrocorticia sp.]